MRLLLLILFFISNLNGAIFDPNRTNDWSNAGIPGGIPIRETIFCTVTEEIPGTNIVAVGDGVVDDNSALVAAINLCPSNQVVYLPAGTYRTSAYLRFASKSSWVLRGAGMTNTTILFDPAATITGALHIGDVEWTIPSARTTAIISGANRGSSNIVVSTTNLIGIAIGKMLNVSVTNTDLVDPTNHAVSSTGSTGNPGTAYDITRDGKRNLSEIVEIKAVGSDNITFWPPLMNYYASSLAPEARLLYYVSSNIGIESLTIRIATNNPVISYAGLVSGIKHSWFKDVEFHKSVGWALFWSHALQNTIQGCKFNDVWSRTVGRGYGLEFRLGHHNLVQDNIFDRFYATLILAGSSGNVIGYNLVTNVISNDPTYGMASLDSCHGAQTTYNLYEGNIAAIRQADFYWGTGALDTDLRNHYYGKDPNWTQFIHAMRIDAYHWSNSVIGNVLGPSDSTGWVYEVVTNGHSLSVPGIYRFGYPSMGNNEWTDLQWYSSHDPVVESTLILHGNYDSVTAGTVWSENIEDTNIVESLYLTSRPSWFGGLAWPPIGPEKDPMVSMIPAQARYLGLEFMKTNPIITWTGSTNLTYPSTLTATATATWGTNEVEGTLTFSPTNGASLNSGTQVVTITFTPTDTNTYNSVSITASVVVAQADPEFTATQLVSTLTHPAIFSTNYFTPSSVQDASFTYSRSEGSSLSIGNNSVLITCSATDTNYFPTNITFTISVTGVISGKAHAAFGSTNTTTGSLIWR